MRTPAVDTISAYQESKLNTAGGLLRSPAIGYRR